MRKTKTVRKRLRNRLQVSSTEEILKRQINNLRLIGKEDYERKMKSPFTINADFQFILVPGDTRKQNPKALYTEKYQKDIVCSYGYKLVCVYNRFRKPFKAYLDKEGV